jgi:hypothetical protein
MIRNPAGSSPGAAPAAPRQRRQTCGALNNTQHHLMHLSSTIPNQAARRINNHSSSSSDETGAVRSKMCINPGYGWTGRGPANYDDCKHHFRKRV